jgi:hypothetical protein
MDISQFKHCGKCSNVYPVSFFFKNKARYDGLSVRCKRCHLENACNPKHIRKAVIAKLGGKCAHCGYDKDIRALALDHVNGDGAQHRKEQKQPNKYYKDMLDDTEGRYQILCFNCNEIKKHEDGEQFTLEVPSPITGELREAVLANKRKAGGQSGSSRPNQKEALAKWREENPDKWLERNEKISVSRTGHIYKRKRNQ